MNTVKLSFPRCFLCLAFSWCFLHSIAVNGQLPCEFGGRVSYQTIILHASPKVSLSQHYRPGLQLGIFWKWLPENLISLRTEGNYSLKGYTLGNDKLAYHYLGVTAIPELEVAGPFSVGIGGFADFLLIDPGDFPATFKRRRLNAGLLLAGFLRYKRVEIQGRYQWSVTPFLSEADEPKLYFQALNLGLAYYFR